MGLLDRLKKAAEGIGSVVSAPIEFVWDVGNGAFTDAELDVWAELTGELGEALEGAFSADRGLGAVIGGVPGPVRRAPINVVGGVLEAGEDAYGVVSRAVAAGVAHRATQRRAGPAGSTVYLPTGDTFERGQELTSGRSPGQVTALAWTADVWSDKSVEERENSWWYSPMSGTIDAVLRLSPLDPLNAAALGARAARVALVDTPVSRVGVDAAMDSRRVARFLDKIDGKNASEIRDQFFSNHAHGAQIASLLAEGDRETRARTLRALMGDGGAYEALRAESADLSHQIQNLMGENAHLWSEGTLFHDPDALARIDQEIEALYPREERVDMLLGLSGAVRTIPRYSVAGELRSTIGRSAFYQKNPLTRPLRVVTNKTPHHWVNLNDSRTDIQVWRQVRDSYLPVDEQDRLRGVYQAASNPAARQAALIEADEAAIRSILDHHGVSQGQVEELLGHYRRQRDTALGALRNRRYDADGRGSVRYTDIDGTEVEVHLPLYVTQQADLVPLSDLKMIDRVAEAVSGSRMGRWRQFRIDHPTTDLPAQALEAFYAVWRPSVLLRFGWPQRIVLDEQLRIASEIGVLASLAKLPRGFKTMGDRAFAAVARKAGFDEGRFALDAVDTRAVARLDRPVTAEGELFASPFGGPGDDANVFLGQVSARGTFRDLVEGERARHLEGLRQHTGHFRVHRPGDADYDAMWGWAVNKHIRQDPMARQFLEGKTVDEVVDWLAGKADASKGRPTLTRRLGSDPAEIDEVFVPANVIDATNALPPPPAGHVRLFRIGREGRFFSEDVHGAYYFRSITRHGLDADTLRYLDLPVDEFERHAPRFSVAEFGAGRDEIREIREVELPADVASRSKVVVPGPVRATRAKNAANADLSGPAYAREMGWRPHTFHAHAEDVADQIDRYLPGDLRTFAAERELSSNDLAAYIPDANQRPPVHGEDLLQAFGKSPLLDRIKKLVGDSFNALGVVPTDVLSRQPYFAHLYRDEIERLAELAVREGRTLDDAAKKAIEKQARRAALDDTQRLLYDLAERSELTEILRFIAPFYSAWQEVLVTWARQTWRNPAFVARARYVWAAPEKAGLVTDENGNVVTADGAENPLTGEKVKAGAERFVTLPFAVPGLPGRMGMSFNKKSLNLALTGSPGVGPLPQVLVNEIVKDRPDLASSLEWVLPFGSTQEVRNILFPAVARRFNQRLAGEEDRIYRNTLIRLMYDRQVEFRAENGRYPNADEREKLYRDAKRDTDTLFNLRTAASFILPFAPVFNSPYKPYIDTYRQMAERVRSDPNTVGGRSMLIADDHGNPRSVDEWFYDEFGPEFLPLAQSLSSSRDGVMPTIEGWKAREEYQDLIEQYPEIGAFIVGAEGAGEFNRSVYDMQLSTPLRPGSGTMQRETPSVEEAAVKPEIAEGWLKYGRAMDLIEAVRIDRGLPSLSVAAAQDLAVIKRAVTAQLAQEFPAWWEAFNQSDRLAFQKRLDGFRAVVADERFRNRDDVRGVAEYLRARDLVLQTLEQRGRSGGAKTLTATSNQDLALVWDAITASLVEKNLAFADVFYRWLERDPMEVGT